MNNTPDLPPTLILSIEYDHEAKVFFTHGQCKNSGIFTEGEDMHILLDRIKECIETAEELEDENAQP